MINQDYPSKNELTTQLYHLNLQYDFGYFSVRSVSGYQHMNSILQEDSSRSSIAQLSSNGTGTCPLVFGTPTCYDDVAGWNTSLNSYTEEFDIISAARQAGTDCRAFLLSQNQPPVRRRIRGRRHTQSRRLHPGQYRGARRSAVKPRLRQRLASDSAFLFGLHSGNLSLLAQSAPDFGRTVQHRLLPGRQLQLLKVWCNSTVDQATAGRGGHWRAEVDYDATPDNLLYVSAARGYKPGGVNGSTGVVIPLSFGAGNRPLRSKLAQRITFSIALCASTPAAFYYLYKNMQYIEDDPKALRRRHFQHPQRPHLRHRRRSVLRQP